ncbi:MAG: hypothetical protein M3437_15265, partial [Chloroflexota bacterium]|nr:hypothetical protein [Chloroflexota bacterium]
IIAVASCYWVLATAMIWRLLRQGNPLARLFIYDHPSIYSTGVRFATTIPSHEQIYLASDFVQLSLSKLT